MKKIHIMARALNTPLLLSPGYAAVFFGALGQRMGVTELVDAAGATHTDLKQLAGSYQSNRRTDGRSYRIQDGVAVIPIDGTLMHKSGYIGSSSGAMGYDGIEAQLTQAMADADVRGILLDIDSPGGEVSGVQALGDIIASSNKPVWAHANELAASAAYWLASQADRLVLSSSAQVGSIGVLTAHADYSQALAEEGIKVTLLFSGAHKVEGNPYESLSPDVAGRIQADIDALRNDFAAAVAKGRGMKKADVLATEAAVYRGKAAVAAGLADEVASFNDTLSKFSKSLSRTGSTALTKGNFMSKAAASSDTGEITQEAHEQAVAAAREEGKAQGHAQAATEHAAAQAAAVEAARAEGRAEGHKVGASAERERISAILRSDASAGRESVAASFALDTDMTAEQAIKALAAVPAINGKAATALAQMGDVAKVDAGAGPSAAKATGLDLFKAAAAKSGVQLKA